MTKAVPPSKKPAAAAAPVATFANQDKLPRLPIPPLDATLQKYRMTLTALLTPEELAATDKAIADSLASGQLHDLHNRLIAYDKTQPNSWLEDWWYRLAYLSWRVPLMINSNWWLFIRDDHLPYLKDKIVRMPKGSFSKHQIKRAAGLVSNLLNFKHLLDTEQLPAEATRAGPLCMDQYRHMFGVTRNAVPDQDVIVRGFPCQAKHIVVIVQDQLFRVPVFDVQGRRIAVEEIERMLAQVVDQVTAPGFKHDFPVTVLTAEHRDTWAKARIHLLSLSPTNKASLSEVESALFTVSLDDFAPGPDLDEGHRVIAHALDGHNRWYDKALNVVVTANGRGGCNGEHSPQDALTPAIMFEHVLANEPARDPAGCVPVGQATCDPVRRLRIANVDGTMLKYLADAEVNNRKLIADSDIGILVYSGYGNEFIKKHARVSPDAYMQLAMQLAHKHMHGYLVPTYETASTRMFKHGRTETNRTLLPEVKQWAEAMVDSAVSDKDKVALFKRACAAHGKYISEASKGMGVDRHLLGMRLCMRADDPPCPLFADPAYARSQAWRLSTSGLSPRSYQNLYGTGFGCVVPDGYGINYFAGPNVMHFGIESKRSCPETSTDRLRLYIMKALGEIRDVIERVNAMEGNAVGGDGKSIQDGQRWPQ
ncbi:acyltransferase ChoActase/COT/CPT [Catenaria anguillulae PL171]|uniref:Acyltransferase ChoActase/COT/CPT n=1 Tax=Catenaria anguillulae PL171 TaxID=765915 RepID=A0A1Y2HB18_9FUNG|nr:acyltransferase ChoActase/COT/CPT [Catenaria anguillulae PL171]